MNPTRVSKQQFVDSMVHALVHSDSQWHLVEIAQHSEAESELIFETQRPLHLYSEGRLIDGPRIVRVYIRAETVTE